MLKFGAFALVAVLSTVLIVNTLRRPLSEPTVTYHAVFGNVLGLDSDSEVRIAGVRVGTVEDLRLTDGRVTVTFEVLADKELPADVHAVVRYADMLGGRYIALLAGESGTSTAAPLPAGATIPASRTQPALDLTKLFNGFKPVFDTLRPEQINQLAGELIAVFQGQGQSINTLLSTVISLTNTLTAQDEVIGKLLGNLRPVLRTTLGHTADFRALVAGLSDLMAGLAHNSELLVTTLQDASSVASMVAELVRDMQPEINRSLAAANSLLTTVLANKQAMTDALGDLPTLLRTLLRTFDYGSWINLYICNLNLNLAGSTIDLRFGPHSEVCRA